MNKFITNYLISKYAKNYMNLNYEYLSKEEKLKINHEITDCLKNIHIENELKEITLNNVINLEGVITFRLNNLKKFLNVIIDESAETIILEKKYSELTQLMKSILELNRFNSQTLDICFYSDNSCSVNLKGSIGANRNFFDKDLYIEDFLIDYILDNVPAKIEIHNVNYIRSRDLIKILYELYGHNIKFCAGCKRCAYMHLI